MVKWDGSTNIIENEFINNSVIKTFDLFGRESLPVKGIPFLYKNEKGSVEKRIVIE